MALSAPATHHRSLETMEVVKSVMKMGFDGQRPGYWRSPQKLARLRGEVIRMSIHQLLRSKRRQILKIAERHGARKVRVFGSVARGQARRGSDIDFLVEMDEGRSLLDHSALILELERLLKRPVDVASERGLRPPIRKEILKDAIAL
ncbi:MAG: nucleotidyltransferase family protein [Nitrospira sp.]|nr:nucleotidyltransferase family protein [Nitrospira sp.]